MLPHLFSPFAIRELQLQNRIVMPALASFLVAPGGSVTEKTLEHYRRRAAGGLAMLIVEAAAVAPEGIVSETQLRIDDDRFIEGLASLARVIKSSGARAAIQLHHAGRQTKAKLIGRLPLAPSPLPCPAIPGEVEALSQEGIRRIVSLFGEAARRAVEAGFELIEVHGAHGYLVNQFLSPFSNVRDDDYGGDTQRRARFAVEVLEEVRRRVGASFPISFKISAKEFVPGGLDVEESVEIVRLLTQAGVDVVQVSAGNDATPEWISQPMLVKRGCLVDTAFAVKKAVDIPVMAVGRINGPRLADEIIREGKADLVCMGRALLADPLLPVKAKEGRLDEIRRCVACNTCMNSIFKKGRVECLVNPELGREEEMGVHLVSRSRRILVVGGGPAGAEAAWVAASRGHEVELFDANDSIGGQILLGALPAYKKDLLNIVRFHEHQLRHHGVRCHLGQRVDAEDLLRRAPDAVVLATGARPSVPSFVVEGPTVETYVTALNGTSEMPRDVVILGGGAIGCELAIHLAQKGHRVAVMEMRDAIGVEHEAMTRKLILQEIRSLGIRVMTGCEIRGLSVGEVVYIGRDGKEAALQAELFILAMGTRPEDALDEPLKRAGLEVYKIGDCVQPRSIKEAIYEGALIGRSI